MSLPTDSVAPAPPTGSSNPWSLVQWWKRICDWIAALSPSGADKYDTGWVDVPLNAGFTNTQTLQVRRCGRTVFMQGRVSGAYTTSNQAVATIPAGFRPASPWRDTINGDTTAATLGALTVNTDGTLFVALTASGTRPANLFTSWPI